jgi:hypothetical protein
MTNQRFPVHPNNINFEDAPFTGDNLKRKDSAERLTKFILSFEPPFTICLSSPYGTGKTTFLRWWKKYLEQKQIPVIYFNAWKSDWAEGALISIFSELEEGIEQYHRDGMELFNGKVPEYVKNAGKSAVQIAKSTSKTLINFFTNGAITEKEWEKFGEIWGKYNGIEQYNSTKKHLKEFRSALEKISESTKNVDDAKFNEIKAPLVIIIDELDRCRPPYALDILEKIKHIFSVKNIVFVLGADQGQLATSIKTIYGQKLDVIGYLQRFINFNFSLPKPESGDFISSLFKNMGITNFFSNRPNTYSEYISYFSQFSYAYNFSLRQQIAFCNNLRILLIEPDLENIVERPVFLSFLIAFKLSNPEQYHSFLEIKSMALNQRSEFISGFIKEHINKLTFAGFTPVFSFKLKNFFENCLSPFSSEKYRLTLKTLRDKLATTPENNPSGFQDTQEQINWFELHGQKTFACFEIVKKDLEITERYLTVHV